jgi:Fe-S cluster assembly protein SufD
MSKKDYIAQYKENLIKTYSNINDVDGQDDMWKFSQALNINMDKKKACRMTTGGNIPKDMAAYEAQIFFRDGFLVSNTGITEVKKLSDGPFEGFGEVFKPRDKFDLNLALSFSEAYMIEIRESVNIYLNHEISESESISFPRVFIKVAENLDVKILETLTGSGELSITFPLTEVMLSANSRLKYYRIQEANYHNSVVANLSFNVKENSELEIFSAQLGAKIDRLVIESNLSGQFSQSNLYALSLGVDDSHHDLRTVQIHSAPNTRSEMLSASVLLEKSEAVYSGLIQIKDGAKKTYAKQTNKNLLVSKECQANSIPNLDIEENDVICDHASSVGPIDPLQIHYLESRCLDNKTAKKLIIRGFFEPPMSKVSDQKVTDIARRKIEEVISESDVD